VVVSRLQDEQRCALIIGESLVLHKEMSLISATGLTSRQTT
jgi:hypothetical protein